MITDEQTSIPLHFKATKEAEYKLHVDAESVTTFPESVSIMLEDTFFPSQEWIDMRNEGFYSFDATPDDELGRFICTSMIWSLGLKMG